jgi:hypothetical protein
VVVEILFLQGAIAGLYLFLCGLNYMYDRIGIEGALPNLVFLTYLGLISACCSLFCGAVGFLCTFLFAKTIY